MKRLVRTTPDAFSYLRARHVVLGSDQSNSLDPAAWANVTGMSFSVIGGVTYSFEWNILYRTAISTTGAAFSVDGPAAPTFLEYCLVGQTTTNAFQSKTGTAYDTVTAMSTGPAATTMLAKLVGTIKPSASGDLQLRFLSEVNASAVTVRAGSFGVLYG